MSRHCGRFYFLKNGETLAVRRTYFRRIPASVPVSSFLRFFPASSLAIHHRIFVLFYPACAFPFHITFIFAHRQIIFLLIKKITLHLNCRRRVYFALFITLNFIYRFLLFL